MQLDNYHIGLPAWAFPGWTGSFFNSQPSALASYASVFNTVEGNTTFYHTPDTQSVEKWCTALISTSFKICFKLPRIITHEKSPDFDHLKLFIDRIAPLTPNLGPFLLQFPSSIGPTDLPFVESILKQLPENYRCAIEVRHPAFFSQPERLEPLLSKYNLGRVCMDTRPVFHGNRNHPEVVAALHDKPDLPVLGKAYNSMVFVRLLLHPDLINNDVYLNQWAKRIDQALAANCECFMMIHCPNNQHCPSLAAVFHERLRQLPTGRNLLPLKSWPVPQQQQLL